MLTAWENRSAAATTQNTITLRPPGWLSSRHLRELFEKLLLIAAVDLTGLIDW